MPILLITRRITTSMKIESASLKLKFSEDFPAEYGISDRNDGSMCFYQANGRNVVENRQHFFKKVGINSDLTFMPDVIHGNEVIEINESDLGKGVYDAKHAAKVDGVISFISGSTLAVDTGDCPVILFSNKEGTMIGLVHAGWKSLDQGVIENIFATIGKRVAPTDILIVLGIGICKECYRFPLNLEHPMLNSPLWDPYKIYQLDDTVSIDLYGFITDRLKKAGVPGKNITSMAKACSFHTKNNEGQPVLFSHRRASIEGQENAKNEGRFITFVHLPEIAEKYQS